MISSPGVFSPSFRYMSHMLKCAQKLKANYPISSVSEGVVLGTAFSQLGRNT